MSESESFHDLKKRQHEDAVRHGEQSRAEARKKFRAFYEAATDGDAALMDTLVLARLAWLATAKMRRDVPPELAAYVERLTDQMDQAFTASREKVRECRTFVTLPQEGRTKIEREVLSVGFDPSSA